MGEFTGVDPSKMSLTSDDQKWLKLLLDRQEEILTEQFNTLKDINVLIGHINKRLDSIEGRLTVLETGVDLKEERLKKIEKYSNIQNSIMRILFAVSISILAFLGIHKYL
jgi:hypothetical protein